MMSCCNRPQDHDGPCEYLVDTGNAPLFDPNRPAPPATTIPTGRERSNRTITAGDVANARAILDVDAKTRALMQLVPSSGMGSHVVADPSGWRVEVTRGEVGCGDAHRFHVSALFTRSGLVVAPIAHSSELLIVARRGQAHVDLPGITVEAAGEWVFSRLHDMVSRVVGVSS